MNETRPIIKNPLFFALLVLICLASVSVLSLPNLSIEHGEACKRCHISPSGAGMRNEYGNYSTALNELCIPPTRKTAVENYRRPRIGDMLTIGFDTRHLVLERDFTILRMQSDFYATVEPMKDLFYHVRFSETGITENYAMMVFGDQKFSIRAGRMYPAFGLKEPDHTSFNRQATGHGPNVYLDGLSLDAELLGADLMVEGFDRFGQGVYGLHLMRAGAMKSIGYLVGASAQFSEEVEGSNGAFPWAQALFGGLSYGRITTMGEFDFAGRHSDTVIVYGSLMFRPTWGVYLQAEYNFMDPDRRYESGVDEYVRLSTTVYPISFVMLQPAYTIYTRGLRDGESDWFLQFHLGY